MIVYHGGTEEIKHPICILNQDIVEKYLEFIKMM